MTDLSTPEVTTEQSEAKGGRIWAAGFTEDEFYRQTKLEDGTIAEIAFPKLTRVDRIRTMIHTDFDERVKQLKEFFGRKETANIPPQKLGKIFYKIFYQAGDILGDSRGQLYQIMNDGSFRKRKAV